MLRCYPSLKRSEHHHKAGLLDKHGEALRDYLLRLNYQKRQPGFPCIAVRETHEHSLETKKPFSLFEPDLNARAALPHWYLGAAQQTTARKALPRKVQRVVPYYNHRTNKRSPVHRND